MTKDIRQIVYFFANPHHVFEALLDEKKHAIFTNASAKIDRKVKGKFSVWDGYASGVTKNLIKDRLIIQTWRASDWPKNIVSEITIELFQEKNKTKLIFTQINVPSDFIEKIKTGWQDYYWKPLEKFLNKKV